jgi:hypothetical protein
LEEEAMKTAYELAMERLAKQAPPVTLSDEQKREIAELDSRYKAKLAERELAAQGEIEKAEVAGNAEAADQARQAWANDRRKLQEDLESRKETVRRKA